MQIILANAKLMTDKSEHEPQSVPMFRDIAGHIAAEMSTMDVDDIAGLLGCNRKIAAEKLLRYRNFPAAQHIAAIMAYNGQAYKHLKASTLNQDALDFAQNHLWITCFLYGLLRPLDAIAPYRMEHTVSLESTDDRPMNRFWRDKLTDILIDSTKADDNILVHLSTGEYEQLFDWQRLCREIRVVHPLFYVRKGGDLKVQAVWAKACRGAMVRFILENNLTDVNRLRDFSYEGFAFDPRLGDEDFPHFVRED